MFQVDKSQSTKTGLRPNLITQRAVEIIENAGIIISSLGLSLRAFKDISNAAVPLETAIPNFLLLNFENSCSNFLTKGPSEEIQLVFRLFST